MAIIDNATGAPLDETAEEKPESTAKVLHMPGVEERTKRTRKAKKKTLGDAINAATESAQSFADELPGELAGNLSAVADGVATAQQGATQALSAGFGIGKLLLIGLAVYFFLDLTADKKLPVYRGD